MANFIADTIDFSAYMESTEGEHKIVSCLTFADDVVDYFWGEKNAGPSLPWQKAFGRIEFRPSEVTLWSGINGHGKSLALGQAVLSLMTQKQRCCIASFEMRPATTLARMCRQALGTNKPSPEEIREFHEITDQWIWLYDQQGTVHADRVLAVIRYAADRKQIKHFVIDSLMKCGLSEDDYTSQKLFLDALCTIARDTGIHIHLVAHSRKDRDESRIPGKMDVKGSGSIVDQVDNCIVWWRNKEKEKATREGNDLAVACPYDAVLSCDKQRNGEWEGQLGFYFEPASLQFVESQMGHPMNMLKFEADRAIR